MRRAKWILLAVVVLVLLVAGRTLAFEELLAAFGARIAGLGAAGFVLYAAAIVLVSVLMLPAWLMTIGAGYLFGVPTGMAVGYAGAMLGASAAFLIGRYLA